MYSLIKLLMVFLCVSNAFASQKSRIKELFQEHADENMAVHPQLIRMAFHDAAHFNLNDGEGYRMGCFVELMDESTNSFAQTCPAHMNMDEAIALRKMIFDQLIAEDFNPTHADLTQLLGALAVDRLSESTAFTQSLYDQIRMGRIDINNCEDVCEHLPDFSVGPSDAAFHERLTNVWEVDIVEKMQDNMGFSELEAVSLLGAHTVGRVVSQFPCTGCDGPWTTNPFVFDNAYFQELNAVRESTQLCGSATDSSCLAPFSKRFNTWWQDQTGRFVNWANQLLAAAGMAELEEESGPASNDVLRPLMLDSDMAVMHMAPELVEAFANDEIAWRVSFNQAYVKMSELGCEFDISGFNLVNDLDVESPSPVILPVVPCPVVACAANGICPAGSAMGLLPCEEGVECCMSCPCCIGSEGSCVPSCPNVMMINSCPNGRMLDTNGCQIDECAPLEFMYTALGNGNDGFCRNSQGTSNWIGDYDLDTEAECKELCDNIFACAGYQYGRNGAPKDCNMYFVAETVSSHTNTFASCQKKLGQLSLEQYTWRGRGYCRDANGNKFHIGSSTEENEWACRLKCEESSLCAGFAYGTPNSPKKCNRYSAAEISTGTSGFGGCWAKIV